MSNEVCLPCHAAGATRVGLQPCIVCSQAKGRRKGARLEVALKRAAAPVGRVAADLALELLVEPVQLVQPVRDRLAVPAQRQLQRVVDEVVLVVAVAQRPRLRPRSCVSP